MDKHSPFSKGPWALVLGATLLAGGVTYGAYSYLGQREARLKEDLMRRAANLQGPKTAVVVPRVDAKPGISVDQDVFVARDIDDDLVYPDTVTAKDFESVRGQKLARALSKGRPLRLTDLQAPEIKDVSSILPPGTRAVTIEIDNINSIAQTLRAGHQVDVFLVTNGESAKGAEGGASSRQVMMFMQNLKVIAAGREFQSIDPEQQQRNEQMVRPGEVKRDGQTFDTVTVLVTPAEAQRLLVGNKVGSYRVALRGKDDEAKVRVAPLAADDVLPPGPRAAPAVEIIVGGKSGGSLTPQLVPQLAQMAAAMNAGSASKGVAPSQPAATESQTPTYQQARPRPLTSAADAAMR
jgi:pilus assembly protein CpaB